MFHGPAFLFSGLLARPYFVDLLMPNTQNRDLFTPENAVALQNTLAAILKRHLSAEAWTWLEEKSQATAQCDTQAFHVAFAAMPRKTGRASLTLTTDEVQAVNTQRTGLTINPWTTDQLARIWLIMHLPQDDEARYVSILENLFKSAEMHELVALYSALPVLAYPAAWAARCAEGIRSNIGDVLQAIMCNNPYPAEYLAEPAWNQLVLKAIFTDNPVQLIMGLDERANQPLADTLSDYAHERWAAHRAVNPLLWRCTTGFLNPTLLADIRRIASSENTLERDAAALVCAHSHFADAQALLKAQPALQQAIDQGITWEAIAHAWYATAHP